MSEKRCMKYWFLLGREPLISGAELVARLKLAKYKYQPPFLQADIEINSHDLIKKLGGTIKIAQELVETVTENKLLEIMTGELEKVEGKIHFGISVYESPTLTIDQVETWGKRIKKSLKEQNRSVRYVFNRELNLSSVSVKKNGLVNRGREFIINTNPDKTYNIAYTLDVQPFEEFGERDFGRPGRDDLSGMLPPKLAIMMINISQAEEFSTILDPFCGSGTILTEAVILGYKNIIGSDYADKSIEDSRKNIEWIQNNESEKLNVKILKADINNISNQIEHGSIDTIITEPYLGKPLRGNEGEAELKKQGEELKKLYIKSFEQFTKILKPGGTVIFIIPRFRQRNGWITIDCVREIEKMGFTQKPLFENNNSLVYARPNQKLGREIFKFTY